jgi:glycosyltransferase involved in cell wall biosynthesis
LRKVAETHILRLDRDIASQRKDGLGIGTLVHIGALFRLAYFVLLVAKFIHRQRIDLVHTNSLKADIIGGIAARIVGKPVLWHVRDRIETDYLPPVVVRVFRRLARLIPHYVLANSRATLRTLHLKTRRARAIPSGIDLTQRVGVVHDGTVLGDPWTRSHQPQNTLAIGLVGRIAKWKGQHVFLEAAAELLPKYPDARFFIIGSALFGEEEYERQIRDFVTSRRMDDQVTFTGFSNNVSQRIADLDIVVHASITGEPFGQVIIEAMAASKPVVATDGGGVPEIVLDGETGFLVPMGNASAMATAIRRLVDNPDLRSQFGLRGRSRVEGLFTIQHTVSSVQSVYDEALVRKPDQIQGAA